MISEIGDSDYTQGSINYSTSSKLLALSKMVQILIKRVRRQFRCLLILCFNLFYVGIINNCLHPKDDVSLADCKLYSICNNIISRNTREKINKMRKDEAIDHQRPNTTWKRSCRQRSEVGRKGMDGSKVPRKQPKTKAKNCVCSTLPGEIGLR